jgi:hypothetical protein
MNVCTDTNTRVSASPPPDAGDCSWIGKDTRGVVEPKYDKRFQDLIRFNHDIVRVDMGDTLGFHRMVTFRPTPYPDPF